MPQNSMEGSPQHELTQEEVFRLLERTASEDHPNPERLGCPSQEALMWFARDAKAFAMNDPIFEHLAKCSECFRFVREHRA